MKLVTERLLLSELTRDHALFILNLMNSPKWKEFIGDRNIHSKKDAENYIQKILDTPKTEYWVIQKRDDAACIGIVTFMKRDYLEYYDIGFALLSEYMGSGFAYEATSIVLKEIQKRVEHTYILATTLPTNIDSINLLGTLGFSFLEKIQPNEEELDLFSISYH